MIIAIVLLALSAADVRAPRVSLLSLGLCLWALATIIPA